MSALLIVLAERPASDSARPSSLAAPPQCGALADALVEAADLADDYDADPDAFNERERAERDPDR
jgi:hypothetical protein